MKSWRTVLTAIPVVILLALAATGIATAIQADDEAEVDLGPQPADFLDAEGAADITGYLVGDSAFANAPAVPYEEELALRAFGCAEGEPIVISLVPRVLNADETAAQDELSDDEKLLTEPLPLVEEEEALADGSEYTAQIPANTPPGFIRFRVECGDLGSDTVGNLVDRDTFEAEQEELPEDERQEVVTTLDVGDTPEALPVPGAEPAA